MPDGVWYFYSSGPCQGAAGPPPSVVHVLMHDPADLEQGLAGAPGLCLRTFELTFRYRVTVELGSLIRSS